MSAAVRRCPPPSAAIHRRPPLPLPTSTSVHCSSCRHPHATHLPPSSLACPPPFPPLQSKFVAANDSVPFLILLQPVNNDEEETRSPSSPVTPNARHIIGCGAANDSVPFLFCCNPTMTMRRRLGCPHIPPPLTRIVLLAVTLPMTRASFYWPWRCR